MENLKNLIIEIEKFMSERGLTYDDSIESLLNALTEEMKTNEQIDSL